MNLRYLIATTGLITLPVIAQPPGKPEPGISGNIALSAAVISSTSNFSGRGNKTISSITEKAPTKTTYMPLPLANVTYTFGEQLNKQFYAGTTNQNIATGIIVIEAGYRYKFESRMQLDVSLLPTIMSSRTWQDPYEIDKARKVTYARGNAFRFQLKNIAATGIEFLPGSGLSIDSAFATKRIEDDLVPDELKRNAHTFYFKGSYRIPFSRTGFILPSFTYLNSKAEGKASSYEQYGAEISLFKLMDRHQIVLTAGYSQRDYGASNPIYNKNQKDNNLNLFIAYRYQNFMDWKDWSFVSFAGQKSADSNIQFYNTNQYITTAGLSYTF